MRQPARKPKTTARGTRSTGPRRFARRLRRRARAARGRLGSRSAAGQFGPLRIGPLRIGPVRLGTARDSPWLRRGALAVALLCVAFLPYPATTGQVVASPATCRSGCHAEQNMQRWSTALPGSWNVLPGLGGTVPASGLAYAAAGHGIVALGTGMTVYVYAGNSGKSLWQDTLSGFPANAEIVSVRVWPGEVTVGVSWSGHRTEAILSDATRSQTGEFPSDLYGGAVAGSAKYTVIVGATAVTSYDNATGHIRWQHPTGPLTQRWQSDGRYLYVSESATGYLGSSPVTALRRIDTVTGAEQQVVATEPLGSPTLYGTSPFAGTLTAAFDGVVLFSSASGVTAYSGDKGAVLWSMPGVVPEGVDPQQRRFYLARGSDLVAVSPQNGRIRAVIPAAGKYTVRDGIALGLDQGANGDAWGYYVAGQRITMTAPGLGWPHYFADLSGIGGSADPGSDLVVIAACGQAGPATTPSPSGTVSPPATSASPSTALPSSSAPASSSASPTLSPSPTPNPPPAIQPCQKPELVALSL
ncbi:MAG TPA: PQQ-binding-like beta-propeller repeat protein [Streptosporangiaceae bacterium]